MSIPSTQFKTVATSHSSLPELKGRGLIGGSTCLCGEEVTADDLVLANFDATAVSTGGGLYLVQSVNGWHGCRRMMQKPDGIAIDQDGRGNWITVPTLEGTRWRVVGTVETVYRSRHIQTLNGGAHGH